MVWSATQNISVSYTHLWVLLVYRMMEELSSLIKVIQLIMAPESTPDIIMGTVTFTKDFV